MKTRAEDGGGRTGCHENENKRADEDAEAACKHPGIPAYRKEYITSRN